MRGCVVINQCNVYVTLLFVITFYKNILAAQMGTGETINILVHSIDDRINRNTNITALNFLRGNLLRLWLFIIHVYVLCQKITLLSLLSNNG